MQKHSGGTIHEGIPFVRPPKQCNLFTQKTQKQSAIDKSQLTTIDEINCQNSIHLKIVIVAIISDRICVLAIGRFLVPKTHILCTLSQNQNHASFYGRCIAAKTKLKCLKQLRMR